MENSEEISIDTNVFIKMIEFYRECEDLSDSKVVEKIEGIVKQYKHFQKHFDEYKYEHKFRGNTNEYSLIKHFDTQIEGRYKYIAKLIDLTANNKNLSQDVVIAKIKEINKRYNEINIMNKEKQHLNMLLDLKYKVDVYDFWKDVLTGKKEICLVDDTYDEIEKHITENNYESHFEDFFYMSKAETNFLLKKCSLVTFKDRKSKNLIDELVHILQGKNSPILEKLKMEPFERAMDEDQNVNNVFGDALILVESNLAGLPFTSLNKKDFFADYEIEGVDKDLDDTIRQRIEHIMKKVPLFSNAPLYKVNELMDENRQRVKIVSPITETVELSEKDKEEGKEDKTKDEKDKEKDDKIEYDKFKQVIVKKVKDEVVDEMLGPQM